ncbi:hypothetical protein KIH74_20525 [Kineosporia sp. J2-2]|uniref:VCBS repeat protein n=1 Tax=Kineosporia corallincola TaxID=2835133 RepID=A0ABS5TJR1_9ACTN|nr:hypothetical protein [Kineosporia corallincola]MBT0771335.1 hypothetical protein [Kineosporia corallincola]
MPPADFAPSWNAQQTGRAPADPPYAAPDSGVPSQGGWAESTPVPQAPADPRSHPQNAASTMPLPLIGDDLDQPYDPGSAGSPAGPQSPAVPPPAPRPPRSPVRRVAAPEPPPAPPKPPKPPKNPVSRRAAVPADRNAYAPPQNGDIWATFSGPIPLPDEELARQGRAPQAPQAKPAPAPRPAAQPGADGPESPLQRFLSVQKPEARFVLLGVAGGLVVLLIVLVALLSGLGGGNSDNTTSAPDPTTTLTGKDATGLKSVKQLKAQNLLRKAGASAGGTVVEAFQWEDKNGLNLVAAIKVPSSKQKTTLKVVQASGLEDGGDPRVLRSMTDPDLPQCNSGRAGGQAAFAKQDSQIMQIRDFDSDGYAEVIVGWSSRCGNNTTASEAKMALITNGDKYIIRGSGVLGSGSGETAAEPAAGKWPEGFYAATSERYTQLFFPVSQ